MAHCGGFVELNNLEDEVILLNKVILNHLKVDLFLLLHVNRALDIIGNHGENIADELSEERLVLHDELRHVHLGQSRGKQVLFSLVFASNGRLT